MEKDENPEGLRPGMVRGQERDVEAELMVYPMCERGTTESGSNGGGSGCFKRIRSLEVKSLAARKVMVYTMYNIGKLRIPTLGN
jgi:hypothetical protein